MKVQSLITQSYLRKYGHFIRFYRLEAMCFEIIYLEQATGMEGWTRESHPTQKYILNVRRCTTRTEH